MWGGKESEIGLGAGTFSHIPLSHDEMVSPRLIAAAAVAAVATAQKSFVVNMSQPLGTFTWPILDCVGTGHAALALRADYREHLVAVQRDIGFRHIRGHGILDDDMYVLASGTLGTPRWN